jgi:hypothetical protein
MMPWYAILDFDAKYQGINVVDDLSSNLPMFSSGFMVFAVLLLLLQACYLKSYWKKKRLL